MIIGWGRSSIGPNHLNLEMPAQRANAPAVSVKRMAQRGTRGGSLPKSDSKLSHWRLRRGVSQQDLARAVGVDVKVYRRLEQGQATPSWPLLINCAIALRVSLDDIVEDDWCRWQVLDRRSATPPDLDELWGDDADRTHIVPPDRAAELRL